MNKKPRGSHPTNPFLYFDIETGGFSGERNSILSISHAREVGPVQSLYANPVPGMEMSSWSEKNVWEPIKKRGVPLQSEKAILQDFLSTLEKNKGGTLTGWNIGYNSTSGFDIPMISARAGAHGLGEKYQSALRGMNVVDIGQEFAWKAAQGVTKHGKEIVDPDLYQQAKGYVKQGHLLQEKFQLSSQEIPRYLSQFHVTETGSVKPGGAKFAGWTQELAAEVFGQKYDAHISEEDVRALREIHGKIGEFGPEQVKAWSRPALRNALVSSAVSRPFDATKRTPERFQTLLKRAQAGGILPEFQEALHARVTESGASIDAIFRGEGIVPEHFRTRGSRFAQKASSIGWKKASFLLEEGVNHLRKHPVAYGIGAAALSVWAAQPGRLFSGKDDAYNTIEGLGHRGIAPKIRKEMTDFGSGSRFVGATSRAWKTFVAINKESNRAIGKITKEIFHGAVQGKPLEIGVAGLTAGKLGILTTDILAGTAGFASFAGVAAAFAGTKYAYEGIKHRKALKTAWEFSKDNPELAKEAFGITTGAILSQLGRYVSKGERNLIGQFIESGGGEYGKQVVLGSIESQFKVKLGDLSFSQMQKTLGKIPGGDDAYNVLEGLYEKGFASILRKVNTDFGSGWIRKALSRGISPTNIAKASEHLTGVKMTPQTIKRLESGQSVNKFLREMRSTIGETVEGQHWRFGEELSGAGAIGKVKMAYGPSGRVGIHKTMRDESSWKTLMEKDSYAAAINPHLFQESRDNTLIAMGFGDFTKGYMDQIRQATNYGEMSWMKYEGMMQRKAREELGDIVPEVYGVGEKSFIQEYAGRQYIGGKQIVGSKLPDTMSNVFKKMYDRPASEIAQSVIHLDPKMDQFIRKGARYQLADWGISVQAPGLGLDIKGMMQPTGFRATARAKEKMQASSSVKEFLEELASESSSKTVRPLPEPISRANGSRLAKWQQTHKAGVKKASQLAKKGGKGHLQKTGTPVITSDDPSLTMKW